MVDLERLHRILRRITNDLHSLRPYVEVDRVELIADPVRLGHVKYLFITVVEGCVDAAQHVCAYEGFGPPSDNSSAVRLLAEHGLVERATADAIASAVGFRNLLVHRYAEIDDELAVSNLDRIGDVDLNVDELTSLL